MEKKGTMSVKATEGDLGKEDATTTAATAAAAATTTTATAIATTTATTTAPASTTVNSQRALTFGVVELEAEGAEVLGAIASVAPILAGVLQLEIKEARREVEPEVVQHPGLVVAQRDRDLGVGEREGGSENGRW